MSRLARYRRLPRDERRVLRVSALLLALTRLLVGRASVPRMRRAAARLAPRSPAPPERLAQLVDAAAGALPGTTSCLARAIALEALLVRAGHAAELRIGVAPRQGRGRLEAHAWVELEGVALDPAASRYAALPLFGVRG